MIDSFGLYGEILAGILPKHGLEMPSVEIMAKNYHGSLKDSISHALGGGIVDELVNQLVHEFVAEQNEHYEIIEHHLFPDAVDLARRAHDCSITQVVVSNRDHTGRLNASPRSIVDRSELAGKIDDVVCGDDSVHRKPKPEVVEHLLANGVVVPETTVVIGDQFVDALFAKSLGARAILVCRDRPEPEHMDRLGTDWHEYVTIVDSLNKVDV